MIIFFLILILMIIIPIPQFCKSGIFNDYIDPKETLCVKGIFVFLVILSHFCGYITLSNNFADQIFITLIGCIGQLMVTMFFFYSGYGIYESFRIKGKKYVVNFPKSRLLITWINFAICVSAFLIEGWMLGDKFTLDRIVLSYIGWDSVGNSNWFMFATFCMYIMFLVSFNVCHDEKLIKSLLMFTSLSILYMFILYFFKESCWWNTALCFPLGMWFSHYKKRIERWIEKKGFLFLLAMLGICFLVTYIIGMKYCSIVYPVAACFFCIIVVLTTMKIKIMNPILAFLGRHVFSIYMLQRLWFIPLSKIKMNQYLFFVLSVALTIGSAIAFDYISTTIKRYINKQ